MFSSVILLDNKRTFKKVAEKSKVSLKNLQEMENSQDRLNILSCSEQLQLKTSSRVKRCLLSFLMDFHNIFLFIEKSFPRKFQVVSKSSLHQIFSRFPPIFNLFSPTTTTLTFPHPPASE
jgi:hypothetical protein